MGSPSPIRLSQLGLALVSTAERLRRPPAFGLQRSQSERKPKVPSFGVRPSCTVATGKFLISRTVRSRAPLRR